MKILVISNLYPPHYVGGYELHCRTIVEALKARGHSVNVLTSDHRIDGCEAIEREPGVYRSLKIHGLFGHPFLGILQLQRLEHHNNQTLTSVLQKMNPDLVYVWNFGGLSKSMLFTLQKVGIPTAFAVCDHWIARSEYADVWLRWWNFDRATLKNRALRQMWTWAGRRRAFQHVAPTNPIRHFKFQRLHFCSRALQESTAAAGFKVGHGAVIYCPLDLERFNSPPKTAAQPLQRLIYVGRLNEDKGIMTALRAMALVRDKFAGQLSVYGRGERDYEKKLISFVREQRLPVTFNALLNPEQMPMVYRSHDALLFTSEWPEPFALTPLEAMASGLAVIGTTTGGSAELFRHGKNALTYTAGNSEELARRILELNRNPILRMQVAQAGHEEVRRRFGEPIIVDQVEAYLEETLHVWEPSPLPSYDYEEALYN
jgi:glycogen(starch) synthase